MRPWALLAALAGLLLVAATVQGTLPASLRQIEEFAHSPGPYRDVIISAADAETYWSGPGVKVLPEGVSAVQMNSEPGVLTGSAHVDFDKLRQRPKANPLLSVFSGQHTVSARARVDSAEAPKAHLALTEVRLDGRLIPMFLVDAALRFFVQPQHPDIGTSFAVPLPRNAISADAEAGRVVVHYPR